MNSRYFFVFLFLWATTSGALRAQEEIELKAGMIITQSVKIKPGIYHIDAPTGLDTAAIMVIKDSVTIDFNGAVLIGSSGAVTPDQFVGNAIFVKNAQKVTIKNGTIKGYKLGLQGNMARTLSVSDVDFSYNYRERLLSTADFESEADTLNYEDNDNHQWRNQGAGMYLYNCNYATITRCKFTNGQNGLLLDLTNNCQISNNDFSFNSAVGIGLYRCMNNKILHNKADWNVRGFSKGNYRDGLGAAGIMLYEQSNNNFVAYNSVTHCSNGIIYWHGRYKFVFGGQGLKGTLFYGNDVSYSIHCGMQFGSVCKAINNKIEHCYKGIHIQNSEELVVTGNSIKDAEIACEIAGSVNLSMYFNRIENCRRGLIFTDNPDKVANPGTVSDYYLINKNAKLVQNLFYNIPKPLDISFTHGVSMTGNQFHTFDKLMTLGQSNDSLVFEQNKLYTDAPGDAAAYINQNELLTGQPFEPPYSGTAITVYAPDKLADAMDVSLPKSQPVGESAIIMTEWGPYNFQYPMILSKKSEKSDELEFLQIIGPAGRWKVAAINGWRNPSPKSGTSPGMIQVTVDKTMPDKSVTLEFFGIGWTPFGEKIVPSVPYKVEYRQ
jgi:parallel beta-helix repeat protein